MSAMGDRALDKKPKKRRYQEQSIGNADWESANAEVLKSVIVAIAARGCAVRFGYSKDGGAYSVGIYEDTDKYTVWIRPNEELDIKLQGIAASFAD